MSKPSIDAHEERFDGWPTLPTPTGAYLPAHDGDIAELSELSERVFDAVRDGAMIDTPSQFNDCEWFTWNALGDGPPLSGLLRYWPDDRAAEQLAVWRSQLDGIA